MNTLDVTIRREVVFLVIAGLICASSGCRPRSSVEAPADTTKAATEYVSQADQLYTQREDLVRLRQAIVLLRQAVTVEPDNYDASWRLAKFNYYLGTHTDDKDERRKAFRDGIEAGKTAVDLQGGKPDGHFWLGANYGGVAQTSAIEGLANVDDIRNEMETVLRLDEGYQNGSAYMVLGLVYLDEPRIVGGDQQKAVAIMEKGLPYGEANAFLHLHLAEAYLRTGRPADARRQLNELISMTPDQNYLPEYKEAEAEARNLLEKLEHSEQYRPIQQSSSIFRRGQGSEACEQQFSRRATSSRIFLCNLGYGDESNLFPRGPRLALNEACTLI